MSPSIDSLKCIQCNCTESMLWKSVGDNQQLCNDCFEQTKLNEKLESEPSRRSDERRSKLRKSTRSTRYNGKSTNGTTISTGLTTSNPTKTNNNIKSSGRGRRNLFRRPPVKAPTIPATTQNVTSVFYKVCFVGFFFNMGFWMESDMDLFLLNRVHTFKSVILSLYVIPIMIYFMHKSVV